MHAPSTDRLVALDLLRGLAALAIVTRHLPWPGGVVGFLPRDYLAVDLFFVLSGFVLARAYWPDLSQGRGGGSFLLQRLIRIYPLYLLATLAAGAFALIHGAPLLPWAATLCANLLFVPALPDSGFGPNLFPFVYPAWSLLWELLANLFLAIAAARLRGPLLPAMLIVGALLVALTARHFGSLDAGARWFDVTGGGCRLLYGFFAGVALFRLHMRLSLRIVVPDWVLGAALLLCFAPGTGLINGASYDAFIAILVFPLLILLGANASSTALSRRIGIGLGGISYATYVLHQPVAQWAKLLVPDAQLAASGIVGMTAMVLVTLAVAWAATRWIDTPIRAWINRRRIRSSPTAPACTAASRIAL